MAHVRLSVIIPFYDDREEALHMVEAVRQSLHDCNDVEFLLVEVDGGSHGNPAMLDYTPSVRFLSALNLPAAKNLGARVANAPFLLFLFPGIFPVGDSVLFMLERLKQDSTQAGLAGRWCNAKGKLEIGYNVRRFPSFSALLLDILLLNKVFPGNRATRFYKMHDFSHGEPIDVEHANDCVLMLRRESVLQMGGFKESYAPGWFDQVELCQSLARSGQRIRFEPEASFVSNEKAPLIDRLVRDHYPEYRRAECLYIRNHFGLAAARLAQAATALGMLVRIAFSLALPAVARNWFLSTLRSYVNDQYVRSLRHEYWTVFKRSIRGEL